MTGGGGAGTIAAARFLRQSGKYKIILGDMDKWAAGLKFADKSYILPPGSSNKFLHVVRSIIIKECVDIFVPLVDEEILKSYELKKDFPELLILLPAYNFTKMVLDKWRLIEELRNNGFPHPKTYLYSHDLKRLKYPYIVKPRRGRGSRNVFEVNSRKQLHGYKDLFNLPAHEILVQEKIIGKEYTVSVVANKSGDLLAVVPKEVIQKRGITIAALTRKNNNIQNLCINIQRKFKANGPFNVQLILRNDGVPVIFEINPRYSTTIALTIKSGVNEIEILTEDIKYSKELMPFTENLVMTRFFDQIFFTEP